LIPVTILLINFVVTFSMHRYVYLAAVCLLFFSLMSITSFLFLVLSIDDRGRAVALLADSILRRHSATEELVLGVQDIVLDLAADDARRLLAEVATHPDLVGHEELALSILLTALEIGGTR
ncbi:MAG TPA: hypothetical protein PKN93_16260, partial [Leptospiraceae bacterium]|nr:hypothetical protein [Leptospiraceae bacterium]